VCFDLLIILLRQLQSHLIALVPKDGVKCTFLFTTNGRPNELLLTYKSSDDDNLIPFRVKVNTIETKYYHDPYYQEISQHIYRQIEPLLPVHSTDQRPKEI